MINIKCCFSKHCTLVQCAVCTGWPKLPQCVFVFVCVFLCSCVCAHYKLLSCACSIWPRWIHCVCMATYVHLFFASELYGPQPYQTHIMRLKVLCSRTLVSTYYPSVSYVVCKLSVLSLQCRMFILCTCDVHCATWAPYQCYPDCLYSIGDKPATDPTTTTSSSLQCSTGTQTHTKTQTHTHRKTHRQSHI